MAKTIDAPTLDLPKDTNLVLPPSGDITRDDLTLEGLGAQVTKNYTDELAFLEEKVQVMVHESSDENAEPMVETYCNGVRQAFIRGQVHTVKRKYVEVLARAKHTAVSTHEKRLPDNQLTTVISKRSALKYPFSIISDPNPLGAAWLKNILAEA